MNKFNLKSIRTLIVALSLLLFTACGPKAETPVTIQAEAAALGPFFAGPNSLIAEHKVDFSSIEGLGDVSKDDLKEIKVNAIKIILNESDSFNFDSFTSASLQLVGSNTGMQTIAIKNPIDANGKELMLEVSEEADLVEYFKNDKFSLVLDLDFMEESYNEEIGAIIVLDLNIKHN